jgi:hypothetical protein
VKEYLSSDKEKVYYLMLMWHLNFLVFGGGGGFTRIILTLAPSGPSQATFKFVPDKLVEP